VSKTITTRQTRLDVKDAQAAPKHRLRSSSTCRGWRGGKASNEDPNIKPMETMTREWLPLSVSLSAAMQIPEGHGLPAESVGHATYGQKLAELMSRPLDPGSYITCLLLCRSGAGPEGGPGHR